MINKLIVIEARCKGYCAFFKRALLAQNNEDKPDVNSETFKVKFEKGWWGGDHTEFQEVLNSTPNTCPKHNGEPVYWFRQNTAYVNEEDNWVIGCKLCEEESNEYWKERWEEIRGM